MPVIRKNSIRRAFRADKLPRLLIATLPMACGPRPNMKRGSPRVHATGRAVSSSCCRVLPGLGSTSCVSGRQPPVPNRAAAENLFLRKQLALDRERQVNARRAADRSGSHSSSWRTASPGARPSPSSNQRRSPGGTAKRSACSGAGGLAPDGRGSRRISSVSSPGWLGTIRRGRRADRGGTPPQAWEARVPAYDPPVHGSAEWWRSESRDGPAVGNVCAESGPGLVACDFCVVVTATFRILYVFVALEVGSRRLHHVNVTSHPTAAWTVQQFREILPEPHGYRFVLHDRDCIFIVLARCRRHRDGCARAPDPSPIADGECTL